MVAVAMASVSPTPARCVFERPCVFVAPDVNPQTAAPGTVLTFRGRGWRPRSKVQAEYGSFCPPHQACDGVGLSTTFRTDRRGRFIFRFRFGRRPPRGVRGPVGAGSEEVRFFGSTPRGARVMRFATPAPPLSTQQQRAEAARMAVASIALAHDIERARPRTVKTSDRQQEEVLRCQDVIRIESPTRRGLVIGRVLDAASDASTYGEAAPEFEAFAARLEAIGITDPLLGRGASAWIAAIRAPRYVPEPAFCNVLYRWRDTGYARDAEPVDPATTGLDEDVGASKDIARAVKRLRDLGVKRSTQDLFAGRILGLENYIEF